MYEYIITLFDEIRYVWKHKYSFATFLFAFNRYAVWIEIALQLNITFGDLATVDVSDCGISISHLIRVDLFGTSGVGLCSFGLGTQRSLSLIDVTLDQMHEDEQSPLDNCNMPQALYWTYVTP